MNDYFVSYNKNDKRWAEWISWALEAEGYTTIIQEWDFRPGNNFVLRMQQATRQSKKTIAVLSKAYLDASYTQAEWAEAFARDPLGKDRTLLPVRVADCSPAGLLGPVVYVDMVGLNEEQARDALIKSLSDRGKPDIPPMFPGGHLSALRGDDSRRRPFPGPTPLSASLDHDICDSHRYLDTQTSHLSEELKQANIRRAALLKAGADPKSVEVEIKELKRELRRGGQLKPGDQLEHGRYLLLNPIGRGGFATVWKAKDESTGGEVAIKVLRTEHASHLSTRERFFRGARIMAELADNDGIVSVVDSHCEDDGFFYFVMEMLHGGNLAEAVLQRRVGPDQAVPIMDRILSILAKAHGHPSAYIHRDIKPTNILLTRNNILKLTDFDLVWANDTTGGTHTGMLGTFGYAAPEQCDRAHTVDHRADIYSVAMTGMFVLRGGDLNLHHIMREPHKLIDCLPVTRQLKEVLGRAIEWEPDDRFTSAQEFQTALSHGCPAKARKSKPRRTAGTKNKTTTPRQKKRYTVPSVPARKIEEALETFDREHRHEGRWRSFESNPKHRYAIEYKGKIYPVKKIVSLATGIPIGNFSGGLALNKSVVDLGFGIAPLHAGTRHLDISNGESN